MSPSETVADVLAAHRTGSPLALRTSGTTSADGRIVLRSTESWWSSFEPYTQLTGVGPGARVWIPGPLDSTMNLFAATHAQVVGAEQVADPEAASHACLTPAAYRAVEDRLPDPVVVTLGGMAATGSYRHRIRSYYGAAELSFVAHSLGQGNDQGLPAMTPFPGCEVEVRDGEIWVRSPYLAHGYLPDESGPLRVEHGWATVGDRGRWSDEGLVVLGRPDSVTTAGVTVLLAEVEAALGEAGAVVCFGLPHPRMGEILAAAALDEQSLPSLRDLARRLLDPAYRPHAWFVLESFPLTAAGKIDRRAVAEHCSARMRT